MMLTALIFTLKKGVLMKSFLMMFFILFFLSLNVYAAAEDDTFSTPANTNLTANVLDNDSGLNKKVTSYSSPSHGTLVTTNEDGDFEYKPDDPDYTGTDTFTYAMQYKVGSSLYTDTATVTITITSATSAIDNDICYDSISVSGLDFGMASFLTKTTIPVKNISDADLSDVEVVLASEAVFSAFEDCSVLDGDGGETCSQTSDLNFFNTFTVFNSGITYNLQTLTPNNSKSLYVESLFSFLDTSDYDLLATYTKNGTTYTGKLSQCQSNAQESSNGRPFTIRNPIETRNIRGNVKIIGNTVLCQKDINGQCIETDSPNNSTYLSYIKEVDGFTNSSQAKISDIPDDAEIVWAGFYAQGYTNESLETVRADLNSEPMYLIAPDNTLFALYPEVIDSLQWNGYTYSTFSTVNALIGKKGSEVNGWWTGANIKAREGEDTSLGYFGAWTLVLIYQDSSESFRNITVFDGYTNISSYNQDETIELEGFLTPKSGDINSTFSFFAGEGALAYTGDKLYFNDTEIGNRGNVMYSHTSGFEKNPNKTNNFGIDIQNIDIGTSGANLLGYKDTSATVRFTSTNDSYYPSMFVFTTNLYIPRFCYDYAYKQQGIYFTEENDGSHDPMLTGDVITGEDIEVTLYLKNLVDADINVTDMFIDITDINTTQVNYVANSTKLARAGELYPTDLEDGVDVNIGTDSNGFEYIKDISIGTIDTNEYFYTYYSLNPKESSLNMPINAKARYTLTIAETPIYYDLPIGSDVPLCTTSNFAYAPREGIFNIVHNNYYDLDMGGDYTYYNLPTQITSREGNFKVISMDPQNLDTLKETATVVAVEIIDASAFHDTNASCEEMESALTQRVWLQVGDMVNEINATSALLDANAIANAIANGAVSLKENLPPLTNSADFYKTARQNAAFRISWNVMDENGSLPYVTKENAGNDVSLNWTEAWSGEECVQDMVTNGYGNDNKVASYCNFTGGSPDEIAACMECIYGAHTEVVCSRDNFAIRPEAFLMQIDDQNQTDSTQQADITTLADSGSSGAVAPASINLAAGYSYNIEINATNHLNNNSSSGYTRSFNSGLPNDIAQYLWEPRTGVTAGACNDESNKSLEIRFVNGEVDANTNVSQVGEYRLRLRDRTWTSVDSDVNYMIHHSGSHFTSTLDCRIDSSVVLNVNTSITPTDPTTLNGCDITSSHTNNEANIRYNDYNVTFFPYKFDLSGIVPSLRLNHTAVSTNSFVYMSDISKNTDENMSYHLIGHIIVAGENNTPLSNFVDGCYAKPINIFINKDTNISLPVAYRYRLHTKDQNGTELRDTNATDLNNTNGPINLVTADFPKDLNGKADTILNLNYDRDTNKTVNPIEFAFINYEVNCTNPAVDCAFKADLTDKNTTGLKDLNSSIKIRHYYGRAHAGKQRYQVPDDAPYKANIYYEIYCFKTGCNTALIQPVNPKLLHVDDIRWYQNTEHTASTDGNATAVFEKGGIDKVKSEDTAGNDTLNNITNPATVQLTYDESLGYPYTTTMEINASGWLIYNEDDANAMTNPFQVEFNKFKEGWVGKHETSATTDTNGSVKTNRRIMW